MKKLLSMNIPLTAGTDEIFVVISEFIQSFEKGKTSPFDNPRRTLGRIKNVNILRKGSP